MAVSGLTSSVPISASIEREEMAGEGTWCRRVQEPWRGSFGLDLFGHHLCLHRAQEMASLGTCAAEIKWACSEWRCQCGTLGLVGRGRSGTAAQRRSRRAGAAGAAGATPGIRQEGWPAAAGTEDAAVCTATQHAQQTRWRRRCSRRHPGHSPGRVAGCSGRRGRSSGHSSATGTADALAPPAQQARSALAARAAGLQAQHAQHLQHA